MVPNEYENKMPINHLTIHHNKKGDLHLRSTRRNTIESIMRDTKWTHGWKWRRVTGYSKSRRNPTTSYIYDIIQTFSVLISKGDNSGVGAHGAVRSSTASSFTWLITLPPTPNMLAFSGSMFWMLLAMSSQSGGRRKTSSSLPGSVVLMET